MLSVITLTGNSGDFHFKEVLKKIITNPQRTIQGNCSAPNWSRVPYPLPGLNDFRMDAVTNFFARTTDSFISNPFARQVAIAEA
jgi:hypothetical protein